VAVRPEENGLRWREECRQHNIRLELTTQHNILGERHGCLLLQTLGPWSFRVTLLALQLKLFVISRPHRETVQVDLRCSNRSRWPSQDREKSALLAYPDGMPAEVHSL
jgi:hypothetical protein